MNQQSIQMADSGTNADGNGSTRKRVSDATGPSVAAMISTDVVLRLARATPEQKALVDAILDGRSPAVPQAPAPVCAKPEPETFIRKEEAARRLGVKLRTLDAWIAQGRIPFYRIGHSCRLRWSEVEEHLKATCRVCRRVGR